MTEEDLVKLVLLGVFVCAVILIIRKRRRSQAARWGHVTRATNELVREVDRAARADSRRRARRPRGASASGSSNVQIQVSNVINVPRGRREK